MILPKLFKKTSTGAIQEWEIQVVDGKNKTADIVTRFGQVGGKTQESRDTVAEGKNIGKANETTPSKQAEAEAVAQWEKKLKKSYVKSVSDAKAGKIDSVIEGGVDPMLAFTFEKQGHKIVYPCYGNPKLDGTRCIAVVAAGSATLWSRTRKRITSMPHIVEALEQLSRETGELDFILDGELFAKHLENDFEELIHLVRQVTPTEGHEQMQLWAYDIVTTAPFEVRFQELAHLIGRDNPALVLVEATLLKSEGDAMDYFANCLQQGFEGAMLRNAPGLYVGKRSPDLIKLKTMTDAEFNIVGIEEGRGKLLGHVGAFVCRTEEGKEFKAKLKGSLGHLKTLFENHDLWEGKRLTVRYQNVTADGAVRFPVGIAIRDYE